MFVAMLLRYHINNNSRNGLIIGAPSDWSFLNTHRLGNVIQKFEGANIFIFNERRNLNLLSINIIVIHLYPFFLPNCSRNC